MIKTIISLSILIAYATAASVKREEYNPDSLLALNNQVNGNRDSASVNSNNSPVYNPSNSNGYSQYYGSPTSTNQNVAANTAASSLNYQPESNSAYADSLASAASNLPPSTNQSPPSAYANNQGNLYYYYYPVQDKNKEINYQASPSNQFTSSIVQPQQNDDQQNQNNQANANQALSQANGNQSPDLNYGSSQDLPYAASGLNENNAASAQNGNNYESQLSNLASSLASQYGFGSNGFNSQFANQLSGLNNLGGLGQNFGEAFSGSMAQPSSVPFLNNDQLSAAMASQLGGFSSSSQSSSGGPFSQLYQQATQVYQGLMNGGNSAQPQFEASQQHPSYAPSTSSGSSFRSKYGLGTIIMPLMALAGLSLLIPTVTSLSTVASRKKRSAEDNLNLQQEGLGNYFERIERYYSLYKNAVQRDECFDRIICELGDAMSGVRGKDAFFDFVDRMMPNGWMNNKSKVSIFKSSALSADNAKCKKYKCH